MKTFVIYSEAETKLDEIASYWSNEFGWVDLASADAFTEEQRFSLNLPIGGEWVELPIIKGE